MFCVSEFRNSRFEATFDLRKRGGIERKADAEYLAPQLVLRALLYVGLCSTPQGASPTGPNRCSQLGQPTAPLQSFRSVDACLILGYVMAYFPAHGSWFMVHGSWFIVRGLWFIAHGSLFMVHVSCLMATK